ncbi:MAG: hypothetical protein WBC18_07860 [Ottowia sp.]|uniref:head-tail joining protein n=1 Tax=Ottowia sp. TaxID=1898956 RepID=UPI003C71555A
MPAPFSSLQDRVNRAVFARLANVEASVGGVMVPGIFGDATALGAVGVAGMSVSQPIVAVLSDRIPGDPYGLPVTIHGLTYTVAQVEADGVGVTRLVLEVT